jgi:AraC-like DNA-binding protein
MSAGMVFDIYKITSPVLACHVQYILFNYSDGSSSSQVITSFANTNICLGVVKEKELICRADGVKCMQPKTGIHSYLSGMYLAPHKFEAIGPLDEICIDFTPLGYYHFFRFPLKTYVFNEDVLSGGLGKEATSFFETVFEIPDFQKRGALIEQFLLSKFIVTDSTFLQQCLHYIDRTGGEITLKQLSSCLQCSEKKVVRAFINNFDLTPKDYMRIVRFRRALASLNTNSTSSLTSLGYEHCYYDQSHFIKDFKFFTGKTPKQIRDTIVDVKQNVIIGIE